MQTFSEINLPESLAFSLDKVGFVEPTVIQKKAIPALLNGQDLLACSETGSGKTGAYLIPMVKDLLENPKAQGLVMAPTRELAQQISEFLKTICPNDREFHTTRLVGGQDIRKQFKSLQRKPRIIVATPGRLIDHLKRNTAQIHKVSHLVLDEGDRMIDMGFAPQLQEILKHLSKDRQTSFFTATLDEKVRKLAKQYLVNPVSVTLNNSRPVSKIKQTVIQVEFKDKDECVLNELIQREGSVIVFVKTKHRTNLLTDYLADHGVEVDLIHGGRTQGQRNKAIRNFKNGKSRVLCATDVAARGIDVPHVEHVINFDLPMQDEDYVHRVGRTARNGAEGEAVSFVTPQEHRDWNRIVKKYEIPDALLEETKQSRSGGRKKSTGGRKKTNSKKRSAGSKKKSFGKKKSASSEKSSSRKTTSVKKRAFSTKEASSKKSSSSKKKSSGIKKASSRKASALKKNSSPSRKKKPTGRKASFKRGAKRKAKRSRYS
ncbi:MAG: DEAD/DEAH box helicase [Bdellovibrionales bacterium]|nr:DEAD/DEAH box helicase [Bdellovibrionales bacterium]NQZ19720.1 DEAD/DEAH box helicase [Bdellovibrionales bacterium]